MGVVRAGSGPFVAPHMTVHDEVGAFYEHARVLEGILRELELSIRLEPLHSGLHEIP